MLMVVFYHCY